MAFGALTESEADGDLTDINMIPLIDVMLVLLVIFIVTAPLLTHAVKIDLPKASSTPNLTKPENVQLAIDATSQVFWNGVVVTQTELVDLLKGAAVRDPQPELHLRAERSTPYEKVAEVMSAAAKEGVTRIGFITEPTYRSN